MQQFSKIMNRFFSMLAFAEDAVCYAGLLIVTFMTFFNVLNRYLLRFEIMWVGDLSLYIFQIFVFACIVFTTRERGHTSVEVVTQILFQKVPRIRKPYKIIIILASIATGLLFALPVQHFAARSIRFPQYATLVRWFNTSWIMQAMFIMLILVLAHLIHLAIIQIHTSSSQEDPESE